MESEVQKYFLLPGEIAFASEPMILSTLLGSCVAVCLYDNRLKIGGMNHYMLPRFTDTGRMLEKGKYGEYAIPRLVDMAQKAGSRRGDLTASVFGGGKVTGHLGSMEQTGMSVVSDRNVEMALLQLKELGIPITRRDTGSDCARKIHMDTQKNEIILTHVQKSKENVALAEKLSEFKKRKIRVLVVDDSRVVRKILTTAINSTDDMEVISEAENPYEARDRIMEENPDVICLDIIMPRMDGLTFLKKLMRYKYIPTVVVSTMAKAGSHMKQSALEAGAFDAIDKDSLSIYQGTQRIENEVFPKLRAAAKSVAPKSVA